MSTPDERSAYDFWRRGNDAVVRKDWDNAIQMYSQCVVLVPDNLIYRQSLRGAAYYRHDFNGAGAKGAATRLTAVRETIGKAWLQKNWNAVDQVAEEGLQISPWDAQLNAAVGEACRQRGYHDVAIFAYQEALKCESSNKDNNQALAKLLEERGEYAQAIDCWRRILKADRTNGEARSKIVELESRLT